MVCFPFISIYFSLFPPDDPPAAVHITAVALVSILRACSPSSWSGGWVNSPQCTVTRSRTKQKRLELEGVR